MRDDPRDVAVRASHHLDRRGVTGRVVQHRHPEAAGGVGDLPGHPAVVRVDLDAAEPAPQDGVGDPGPDAAALGGRVDEHVAEQGRVPGDEPRDVPVRRRVVRGQRRHDDRGPDPDRRARSR